MSNPTMVADLFAPSSHDVGTAQQNLQRAVEQVTNNAVMPFEAEKQSVNRDHVDTYKAISGEAHPHMTAHDVGN